MTPPTGRGGSRTAGVTRYGFDQLAVGDVLEVPAEPHDRSRVRNCLANAARVWADRHAPGARFATRKTDAGARLDRVA